MRAIVGKGFRLCGKGGRLLGMMRPLVGMERLLHYNLFAVHDIYAGGHGDKVNALDLLVEDAAAIEVVDAEGLLGLGGDGDAAVARGDGLGVAIADGVIDAGLTVGFCHVEFLTGEGETGDIVAVVALEVVEHAEADLCLFCEDELDVSNSVIPKSFLAS